MFVAIAALLTEFLTSLSFATIASTVEMTQSLGDSPGPATFKAAHWKSAMSKAQPSPLGSPRAVW
ncbi:hypothetical protein PF007_g21977 [Phytophthora fragariae]|uniref:Amino acid permease/ SLC12A domain-containing protein n=1 Tax=Phytophthora fragariae TaxID=53985 RepID=A0A6A4CAF3_9STRA|nr:hypothetical protein PF003_g35979 [Phytophthora fragariae]KAE9083247.1 hypothetical protein PF007_g21977 [Phytophthora fragariae]KAE9287500.1 hypothetical protein PF001_g20957 [Phytophthora fragariae]